MICDVNKMILATLSRTLFIVYLCIKIYDDVIPALFNTLTQKEEPQNQNNMYKCTYVRCAVAVVLDLSDAQLTSHTTKSVEYHKSGCPEKHHHFLSGMILAHPNFEVEEVREIEEKHALKLADK